MSRTWLALFLVLLCLNAVCAATSWRPKTPPPSSAEKIPSPPKASPPSKVHGDPPGLVFKKSPPPLDSKKSPEPKRSPPLKSKNSPPPIKTPPSTNKSPPPRHPARPTTYPISLYQLLLVTGRGQYCGVTPTSSANLISCSSHRVPHVSSFNLQGRHLMDPILSVSTSLALGLRPYAAWPAGVASDGLVLSKTFTKAAPFALQLARRPGLVNHTLTMLANGTVPLYLMVQPTSTVVGSPESVTRYCRVGPGPASTPRDRLTNQTVGGGKLLVCDLTAHKGATQFRLVPAGWSWNYKRVSFRSVKTHKECSYTWFQKNASYVACRTTQADEGHAMASPVLRRPVLPMRDGAEFMMQTWIEYPLATGLWSTDADRYLVGRGFNTTRTTIDPPAGLVPYLSMIKFANAKSKADGIVAKNTTIEAGDMVLLRSSHSRRYCQVRGSSARIKCAFTLHQILSSKDVATFQFIYEETIMRG